MPPSLELSKPLSRQGKPRLTWCRGIDRHGVTISWALQFGRLQVSEAWLEADEGWMWRLYMLPVHEDPAFPAETMEEAMLDMAHWFRGLGFSVEPAPLDILEGS